MKRRNSVERGDAMAVLVVILVIALIGALGFIVWQNFIKKDEATQENQTQTQTESPKTEKVLSLSEWGVEIPLTDDMATLTVAKAAEEGDAYEAYEISVPESTLFNDSSKTGTQSVGAISRYSQDASDPFGTGKTMKQLAEEDTSGRFVILGDYVYLYQTRHATTYEGSTDAEVAADKTLQKLASESVAEQFKKIRQAE